MTILDFDISREVDAIVAAEEYLLVHGGSVPESITDLHNRAFVVLAQRFTAAALASLTVPGGLVPVADIVAVAIAQTYGWMTYYPGAARRFFERVGPETPDEEALAHAAETVNDTVKTILSSMELVEKAIRERTSA